MNDRRTVFMVIGFLGAYAITSLVFIGGIILALISWHIMVTAEIVALLALLSNPMSACIGAIGGLLASTKSSPPEPPPYVPGVEFRP